MENKTYTLITGACGGLGQAFVRECAMQGRNLLLTGTNAEKTQCLAQKLLQEFDIDVKFSVCDLSSAQSRAQLLKFIKSEKLAISTLINNAGFIAEGAFLSHSDTEILKIIRTNCEGTIDLTQKIIKLAKNRRPLEILTVSSLGACYPMPQMAIYAATKRMLLSFMIALREEVKPLGIKVSTLCPGGIPTTDAMKKAITSQGFSGKLSSKSPEVVARAALKGLSKNKAVIIPGFFNRFLKVAGKPVSEVLIAKAINSRWRKSQKKRSQN